MRLYEKMAENFENILDFFVSEVQKCQKIDPRRKTSNYVMKLYQKMSENF